ncbi:MAG: hypothetical protein IJM34_00165 [Lachnospiraceae bacterium]|nr:hypothetical protein [Lachnospiraceae bacterium]
MKKIIHAKVKFVKSFLCLSLLFSACGKKEDPALPKYKESMEAYTSEIINLSSSLDSLDPSSEESVSKLLKTVDELAATLHNMAALEVPANYADAGTIASEAYDLMNDSAALYHSAYDSGSYDEDSAVLAKQQYEYSMQRVSAIGEYLMTAE